MFYYSSLLIIKILQFNCLLKKNSEHLLGQRDCKTKDGKAGEKEFPWYYQKIISLGKLSSCTVEEIIST